MIDISNEQGNNKKQLNNTENNFNATGTQYHNEHADDVPDYGNNSINQKVIDKDSQKQ
ncbi:hypothetical protein ACQKCU_24850 [Heyndrickxia sporothermodurans]